MAGRATHHHGQGHNFQKMGKIEGWADSLTLIGILVLGGAMAFGLLTATGHVTW